MDGTLTDTLPLCVAAIRDALEECAGLRYSAEEVAAMFGPNERGIFRTTAPEHVDRCFEAFLAFYEREHDAYVWPLPGVEELLAFVVDGGWRVGVVTAKGAESAAVTARRLGLDRFIDDADVRAGTEQRGSKPGNIRSLLDGWGLEPAEAAYVGDSGHDVDAARAVGARAWGAAWAPGTDAAALRAAGADEVFSSPDELRAKLAGETFATSG